MFKIYLVILGINDTEIAILNGSRSDDQNENPEIFLEPNPNNFGYPVACIYCTTVQQLRASLF